MPKIEIRQAGADDIALLGAALEQLSDELGDRHRASAADLAAACLAPYPAAHGFLALDVGDPVGAALVSPVFSTTKGAPGVFVSDLWVAAGQRGQGLGRRLLAAVAAFGRDRWGATFVKLTVYTDNEPARAFYRHLGFCIAPKDRTLLLAEPELKTLAADPR